MIAREIFTDYSLGADQLGTPIEKSHHIFLPAPRFFVKQYWSHFLDVLTFVNIGPFSTRLEKRTLETDFQFCE